MIAINAIYKDGELFFQFDKPLEKGPIEVIVVFPEYNLTEFPEAWVDHEPFPDEETLFDF